MKKINAMLHDERVQGNMFIVTLFVIIAVIAILTWGK